MNEFTSTQKCLRSRAEDTSLFVRPALSQRVLSRVGTRRLICPSPKGKEGDARTQAKQTLFIRVDTAR